MRLPTDTLRKSAALLGLALAVASCRGGDVVAEVGKARLRLADLEAYQGGKGRGGDARAALEALVERTLLAEAGRRAGVAEDPAVAARVAGAAREIVAQAYLEKELAASGREDVLRKRYAESKDRLAKKRIHVKHIVARFGAGPAERPAAESKISRAAARLAGGEPFEKVASDLSDDPVSGGRGGDLGEILEGQVDPTFFGKAAALKHGQVSGIVESPFGLHLIRAEEDPVVVTPSFDEARGLLAADARREAEQALVARLRGEISVTLHPDRLAAVAPRAEEKPR